MFSTSTWGLGLYLESLVGKGVCNPPTTPQPEQRRLRVGILGTGNIGCDLLIKLLKTNFAEVTVFAGRRHNSPGLELARRLQVPCTELGIKYFIDKPDCCDLVFDCTSAASAISHAATLKTLNIKVVDLTPAKLGVICVPVINAEVALSHDNINMITCGGQAILPLLHCIVTETANVEYVEVVSQIASASAGMSTRANIDNYIHTTEAAIQHFTNVHACKAVLNLNPAVPEVDMQTTAFLRYSKPSFDIDCLAKALEERINHIRRYVESYMLVLPPTLRENVLVLSIKVMGSGDYLPKYAGNLDIINCAAIEVARKVATAGAVTRL